MGIEEELLQGMKEAFPTATGRGEVAEEVITPVIPPENGMIQDKVEITEKVESPEKVAPVFDLSDFNEK